MASVVAVEEVTGAAARRRFVELPHALHGGDPRFAPLVLAWERARIDPHRNPALADAEVVLLLARRGGRPVGRISAHLPAGDGDGRFGHWWVDDDPEAAARLLEEAGHWLRERGASSLTGPLSFNAAQEAGVLVAGHGAPGTTGRPWHPPHLAALLEAHGFEVRSSSARWRVPVEPVTDPPPPPAARRRAVLGFPGPAGPYADERLVLPEIEAVPDVSEALRAGGLRGAWAAARAARAGAWRTAVAVGDVADPDRSVPALLAAAAAAGYRDVVAPWSPDDRAPETVHALVGRTL